MKHRGNQIRVCADAAYQIFTKARCLGAVTLYYELRPGNIWQIESDTNLFDSTDIGSCFLFVGQHALCLQGVQG